MTSTTEGSAGIEGILWRHAARVHPGYERGRYDGWVLCPRRHAEKHLRCVLETNLKCVGDDGKPEVDCNVQTIESFPLERAIEVFSALCRYHPGDDLVFAVGDLQ